MEFSIKDGTGSNTEALVDKTNRLTVRAVSETAQLEAASIGESYQVGSGFINLTSATESAIIYFKNEEDRDVLLTGVNITSSASTGGTENVMKAIIYLKPDGLSTSTLGEPFNNRFGSSETLNSTVITGAEAATVTNGTAAGGFYIPIETFFNTDIAWVIPKGISLALSFIPPPSNTSLTVTITLEAHIRHIL